MTANELFDQLMKKLDSFQYIPTSQMPNIDLYMDQVTTFMDTYLAGTKRYPDDKVLTKTMINNYAKNNLLPSPVNKKYSEKHMILLLYIYYMKTFLSISDIETILKPMTDMFWDDSSSPDFADIYEKLFSRALQEKPNIQEELNEYFRFTQDIFSNEDLKKENYLQLFSLLSIICYDIYLKRQMVTGIVDAMKKQQEEDALHEKEAAKEKRSKK